MDIKRSDEKLIKTLDDIQVENANQIYIGGLRSGKTLISQLERIKEIIYNEKISNIEARLMIKDVLEGK